MDYISMPDGFFGEQNYLKRKYYIIRSWEFISKKGKIFYFHRKKITKKGNFDGLYKRLWENISKKRKSVDSSQKKYFQKRKF